jgi:hypothetical protein
MRKKMEQLPGVDVGQIIEWGNDLEPITKMRGWALIESYMIRRIDVDNLIMADEVTPLQRGMARAYAELMQWINLTILKRNELLEKERLKHETKSVPREQEEQRV